MSDGACSAFGQPMVGREYYHVPRVALALPSLDGAYEPSASQRSSDSCRRGRWRSLTARTATSTAPPSTWRIRTAPSQPRQDSEAASPAGDGAGARGARVRPRARVARRKHAPCERAQADVRVRPGTSHQREQALACFQKCGAIRRRTAFTGGRPLASNAALLTGAGLDQ